MLKIGYDITPLVGICTGVGNYTRQLLRHMLDQDGEHEFLLFSNNPAAHAEIAPSQRATLSIRPFPSRMLWMQSVLPRMLRADLPDLCHYPNSIGPLRNPCRYVVTIHDMTLSLLPEYHPWRRRMLRRLYELERRNRELEQALDRLIYPEMAA